MITTLINQKEIPSVTISIVDYDRLISNNNFLECLEACGVDNWQGYDDAVDMFRETGDN